MPDQLSILQKLRLLLGLLGRYRRQDRRPLRAERRGTFFSAETGTPEPRTGFAPVSLPDGWKELGWSADKSPRWCNHHQRSHDEADDFGALCQAWGEADEAERARLRVWMPWRRLWR